MPPAAQPFVQALRHFKTCVKICQKPYVAKTFKKKSYIFTF